MHSTFTMQYGIIAIQFLSQTLNEPGLIFFCCKNCETDLRIFLNSSHQNFSLIIGNSEPHRGCQLRRHYLMLFAFATKILWIVFVFSSSWHGIRNLKSRTIQNHHFYHESLIVKIFHNTIENSNYKLLQLDVRIYFFAEIVHGSFIGFIDQLDDTIDVTVWKPTRAAPVLSKSHSLIVFFCCIIRTTNNFTQFYSKNRSKILNILVVMHYNIQEI